MAVHLRIEPLVSAPYQEVSYIVWQEGHPHSFVVDPGFEPDRLIHRIDELGLEVTTILNTHGHADHIAGNRAVKERFPQAPIVIGTGDAPMLSNPRRNLSAMGGGFVTSPPADRLVSDGDRIEAAGLEWEVREIPGHSPGHIVYIWRDGDPPIVFGGDVLFAGGIGRFDFPGGNGPLLLAGIREKLYSLPGSTIVYPGHGPPTRIADEQAHNPFTLER